MVIHYDLGMLSSFVDGFVSYLSYPTDLGMLSKFVVLSFASLFNFIYYLCFLFLGWNSLCIHWLWWWPSWVEIKKNWHILHGRISWMVNQQWQQCFSHWGFCYFLYVIIHFLRKVQNVVHIDLELLHFTFLVWRLQILWLAMSSSHSSYSLVDYY